MGGKLESEGEIRGEGIRFRVGVPLAQAALSGVAAIIAGVLIISLAMWPDALGVWWLPVVSGVAWFCYLLGWRTYRDLRSPYEVEHETGEDVNRDGYVGDPRPAITDKAVEFWVERILARMYQGRGVAKADMVGKWFEGKRMGYDDWKYARRRLLSRGVVQEADNRGAIELKPEYPTFAAAWHRYVKAPHGGAYVVNQEDDLVEAE